MNKTEINHISVDEHEGSLKTFIMLSDGKRLSIQTTGEYRIANTIIHINNSLPKNVAQTVVLSFIRLLEEKKVLS